MNRPLTIPEVAERWGWRTYARFSDSYLKGAIDTLDLGVAEVGENRRRKA